MPHAQILCQVSPSIMFAAVAIDAPRKVANARFEDVQAV